MLWNVLLEMHVREHLGVLMAPLMAAPSARDMYGNFFFFQEVVVRKQTTE